MMSCLPVPVCSSEDSGTHAPPPGPASLKGCTPLTLARAGEVVVILGHVGHDAEAVRDTHGDHVIGVQESRDTQLLLSHFKGLGGADARVGEGLRQGGKHVGWGAGAGVGEGCGVHRSSHKQEEEDEAGSAGATLHRPSFAQRGEGDEGRGDCYLEKGKVWRSRHKRARGEQGVGRGAARAPVQGSCSGSWSTSPSPQLLPCKTPALRYTPSQNTQPRGLPSVWGTHQTVILEDIVLGK